MENNSVARPGAGKRDAPRNRRLCCDQPCTVFRRLLAGAVGCSAPTAFFRGVSFCYGRASARYAAAGKEMRGEKIGVFAFVEGLIRVLQTNIVLEPKGPPNSAPHRSGRTHPLFLH